MYIIKKLLFLEMSKRVYNIINVYKGYNIIVYRYINLPFVIEAAASEKRPARHMFPATEKVYSSPRRYAYKHEPIRIL